MKALCLRFSFTLFISGADKKIEIRDRGKKVEGKSQIVFLVGPELLGPPPN
jgi:hypothetical protein